MLFEVRQLFFLDPEFGFFFSKQLFRILTRRITRFEINDSKMWVSEMLY